MDSGTIATWITLGGAVAAQAGGFVWWLSKLSAGQASIIIEQAEMKTLPERVLTLEHNHAQMVATRSTLKELNDREHESIRQDMRQIRERHHEMAGTMQNINLNLELIKQFINDLKDERKAERAKEQD